MNGGKGIHDNRLWTSDLNRREEIRAPFRGRGPVRFYDTTLRDGEQTVGAVFTPDEKVEIAKLLDRLGVERIEAGFPKVSGDDLEAFQRILKLGLRAEIWGFSRALPADLEPLIEMGVRHTVIEVPSSPVKLRAYGLSTDTVIERARGAIRFACGAGMRIAFFPVDATRADLDFLRELYLAACEAGAQEAVVVDTIGACGPEAVEFLVSTVRSWLGDEVELHFHGHNDFGLATASAVAAVRAGAGWIHGTVNGMGERAGNADLAEVALALGALYGVSNKLDLKRIRVVSRVVQKAGGYRVDAWKPLVGENLFVRESGAVAGQFHLPEAIEPYAAEIVGAERERRIVLGKKSGAESLKIKAAELGLTLPESAIGTLLERVKRLSIDKGGLLTDAEFRTLVESWTDS